MGKFRGVILISLIVLMSCNITANAQIPPPNVEAGVIDKADKIQKEQFENNTEQFLKSKEEVQVKVINENKDKNEVPAVLQIPKFILNQVNYTGNTVFELAELESYTSELIGKEITLKELNQYLSKITDLYRTRGYLTSFAYIPPQKIEKGVVNVKILEGKIGIINIDGNKWARTSYIRNNILKNNDVEKTEIFNVNNLRKSLGELSNKDYLKGEVTLQRSSEAESTDLNLKIKDRFPLGLNVNWNNTGRDLIGVKKTGISIFDRNLTGFGDILYTSVSLSSRALGVGTDYKIPIGPYGTQLGVNYSLSNAELGGVYKTYDIDSVSHSITSSLFQPIYENDRVNITSDIGFDFRHGRTTIEDRPLSKYELRVLKAGVTTAINDNSGRWITRGEISTGLPIMGGTSTSSYGVGSSKFVKLNCNVARTQYLPEKFLAIARISGQYSPDSLLAAEQMQLGGVSTVRGFDEGILLGDIGYNISLEIRRPIPYLPNIKIPYLPSKMNTIKLKDRVQLAAFYDQGFGFAIHQGKSEHYTNFLQSVGIGIRCYINKFMFANLDMGIPLGRKRYNDQNDVKIHFSLGSDLI